MATIETRDYMNCSDAAEALDLSPDTIRRYCNNYEENKKNRRNADWKKKTPELKGIHIGTGREWLIHRREIARYQRERNGIGRPVEA